MEQGGSSCENLLSMCPILTTEENSQTIWTSSSPHGINTRCFGKHLFSISSEVSCTFLVLLDISDTFFPWHRNCYNIPRKANEVCWLIRAIVAYVFSLFLLCIRDIDGKICSLFFLRDSRRHYVWKDFT